MDSLRAKLIEYARERGLGTQSETAASFALEALTGSFRDIRVAERAATEGVMRGWTRRCSMRAQAVLCSIIRGCDGLRKTDPSKAVIWAIRYEILNPSAEPENDDPYRFTSFMGYKSDLNTCTRQFLEDLDPYPFHFIQHLAHACHIIAVFHTDEKICTYYRKLYECIIIDGMHALPEPDEVMIERLKDR